MAGRCSMCFYGLLRSKSSQVVFNHASRKLLSTQNQIKAPSPFLSSPFSKYFINSNVYFSTQKPSDVKILSDEILKATLSKQSSQAGDDDSSNKNSDDTNKSSGFSQRAMKWTFLTFGSVFTGMLGLAIYEWGAPPRDEEGNIIVYGGKTIKRIPLKISLKLLKSFFLGWVQDEYSHMPIFQAYLYRTYREMMYYNKLIKEPSREKLLPDPLTEPYTQPPYTLCLEMTGILVHPDWSYQTGWRFKKRPGVDYFLKNAGPPLFELVIYTSEQGFTALPILDTLDPNCYIMYRLYRDATRYMDGHHVKDLSCLNRDLSKVIFIDWNEKSFKLQPRNALHLKKWTGNDDDRTLYDLANLLRAIATSEIEDVRTVLDYYSQFDDPIQAFKDNQRRLQEEEEKRMQEDKGKKPNLASAWSSNLLRKR